MNIVLKSQNSSLQQLLQRATVVRNKFTPISYFKYVSCDFQRTLGNLDIEKETAVQPESFLANIKVNFLTFGVDTYGEDKQVSEHKIERKRLVDQFVDVHRDRSVIVFTDGSIDNNYTGVGSCAAVLLPLESQSKETVSTEVFNVLADNVEAELCGIAFAMEWTWLCSTMLFCQPQFRISCLFCQTVNRRSTWL